MEELLAFLKTGWTPGGVGIWVLVVMAALAVWKGLPALLDAWTRRADAEAKRVNDEFSRLREEITATHSLHEKCEERIIEVTERYEGRIAKLYEQIDDLRCQLAGAIEKIAAISAARAQQQVSTANLIARGMPDNEGLRLQELAAQATGAIEKK